jgi:hypothetical protein
MPPVPPAPPSYGGPPPPPPAAKLPWEDRATIGFGAGLMQTIKVFFTAPRAAFDSAARKGDYASPVLWTIVIMIIALIIQFIYSIMLVGPMTAIITSILPPEAQTEFLATMAASTGFSMVMNALMIPIFAVLAVIGAFIMAAIYHVCLMMAGGSQSDAGFEGTFRAMSYSYSAQVAGIVPIVGSLIALIWGIVLMVIGMSSIHRLSTGKAVIVVLIPAFLCCACLSVGIAMFAGTMMAAMQNR